MQGELRGQSRLRHFEQIARAYLGDPQEQLREEGVFRGRERGYVAAEMVRELATAHGQHQSRLGPRNKNTI